MLNEFGSQLGQEAGKIGSEILRQQIVRTGLTQDLQASEPGLSPIAEQRIAQKRVLVKFARANHDWRLLKFKQKKFMRGSLCFGLGLSTVLLCCLLRGKGQGKPKVEFSKPVPIS